MLTSAMAQTMQHSGHNPGSKCSVIWVLFPESPTSPMTISQSCGGTQPLMTSNFFGGSLSDGLGQLSGSRLLSLRKMMPSMEDRIEDHECAFPKPNNLLLSLARAMQDSFTCLDLLKTTFTEMTIGVTKFQRYYLELYSCLDYIKIYKPHMDGARLLAESVINCMGAITNIFTWQVYLFGSSDLQQPGTALSDATY